MALTLRARLERWLNHIWYDGKSVPLVLRALSYVYARFVPAASTLDPADMKLPPIVIVGNLTIGGSGKTPVVIWLVQQAMDAGLNVGVISRGYGGSNAKSNQVMEVQSDGDWRVCGDEALLIKRRTGVRVAVCSDRVQAARLIANGLDLIISDDGLQNPKIPRSAEILVVDGQRRFGNGLLLPAGPLRAALSRDLAARFPWRICNGGAADAGEYAMQLIGDVATQSSSGQIKSLRDFSDVFALAGIGNPARFYQKLAVDIAQITPIDVGDHQLLDAKELISALEQKPVLTTEKDALKYPAHSNLWVVKVDAALEPALWHQLRAVLKV